MTTFTDCRQSSAIDIVPEPFDSRMRSPPFSIKLLYFFISESIGLKLSPCVDAAHVAEGEIAGLSHVPLRTVLRVGAGRYAEDAACGFTIGFITRIMCCVITLVCFKFPLFRCNPRQRSTFNAAKVGPYQHLPGCGADHGAGTIAHHRERPGIKALYVCIIAGSYRSDGCIKIIHNGTF